METPITSEPRTLRVIEPPENRRLAFLAKIVDTGIVVLDANRDLEMVGDRFCELIGHPGGVNDEDARVVFGRDPRWLRLSECFDPLLETLAGDDQVTEREVDVELETDLVTRHLVLKLFALEGGGFMIQAQDRRGLEALEGDLRLAAYQRSLTRLYLGATHDLKGPLNALHLQLEVLERTLSQCQFDALTSERLDRTSTALRDELERLWGMVLSLLSQTAPASESSEPCEAGKIVDDVYKLVTPQARQQRIRIELIGSDEPIYVDGFREQLRQALLNLVINALEAIEGEGRIELSWKGNEDQVEIRVIDSGPGIDPSIRGRLFEMHTTNKSSGTGIGLWVVRNTLRAHGGTVEIEASVPGRTVFCIKLPRLAGANTGHTPLD